MDEQPRVWVGCLGCYNAGSLAGLWFDAIDCPTDMEAFNEAIDFEPSARWEQEEDAYRNTGGKAVEKKVRVSVSDEHGDPVYGPHEELWVMDHENFGEFLTGECSPDTAKKIAEWLDEHDDLELPAFGKWLANYDASASVDEWGDLVDQFEEAYAGHTDSLNDWAWEWLEGNGYFEGMPEHLETHQSAIVADWLSNAENGGEITTESADDGGLYIYWNR